MKRTDASYESGWLVNPPLEMRDVAEAKKDVALKLAIASDRAPNYDHDEYISHDCRNIVSAEVQPGPDTPSNKAIFGLVKRARIEVLRREQAKLSDGSSLFQVGKFSRTSPAMR